MAGTNKNLGKANPKVIVTDYLPNIQKEPKRYDFNISAHDWNVIVNSQYFQPLLTENIIDEKTNFAVCFPAKRIFPVNNFISEDEEFGVEEDLPSEERQKIMWKPIDVVQYEGIVGELFGFGGFPEYDLEFPHQYSEEYEGPKWGNRSHNREPESNDMSTICGFEQFFTEEIVVTEPYIFDDNVLPTTWFIEQMVARDGLWWGVESDGFLGLQMPFWIHVKRTELSPSSWEYDTYLIICLGIEGTVFGNEYDIVLSNNAKPRIVDYLYGRAGSGSEYVNDVSYDIDTARVLRTEKDIEIGIIPIGGRLVVYVNKEVMVYSRPNNPDGSIDPVTIEGAGLTGGGDEAGAIRIYGTNIRCNINVSPMVFSPVSLMALPIVEIQVEGFDPEIPIYQGIDHEGEMEGSVFKLPISPQDVSSGGEELWGVDCDEAKCEADEEATPQISFLLSSGGGKAILSRAPESFIGSDVLPSTSFYVLELHSEDSEFKGEVLPLGKCPFFFRMQGAYEKELQEPSGSDEDVTIDVISISENASAPDYVHAVSKANVVLYNKDGKYDKYKNQQHGINISWGWEDEVEKTFTGIIVSATTREEKGKEIIELDCHDYMYLLKNIPIINSPFYDGMLSYYAIVDLAKRAGVVTSIDKFEEDKNVYFLPSSYNFTQPASRFESQQSLFDCIKWVAEKDQSIFYFNKDGELVVEKLPGGLFSVDGSPVADFEKTTEPGYETILNEKELEGNLDSTVNWISIYTVDRLTRNPIIYSIVPGTIDVPDILLFRKALFLDQPALGEYGAAALYAAQLGHRVFYPIRKTSVTTVGHPDVFVKPLDFVNVDSQMFRCIGVSRRFSADNNDYTSSYECEWNGGA